MKKILLSIGILLVGFLSQAQSGLEGIIVEKYYVSNAADAAGSDGVLPVGSITYRVYANLAAGYNLQAVYGDPVHGLTFSASTGFFNNEDRGAVTPSYTRAQAPTGTVLLDSWLTMGGAAAGSIGVQKTIDSDGTLVTAGQTTLKNNDSYAGIALSTSDGLIVGTPATPSFSPGFDVSLATFFGATSNATGTSQAAAFNGDAMYVAGGVTGPDAATNIVLIGQFTTNGTFEFEINLQIGTPSATTEKWVSSNPQAGEFTLLGLEGAYAPNIAPTCSLTAPTTGTTVSTGTAVTVTASADDLLGVGGSISQVEFFAGATSIGTDATLPYSITYTPTTTGTISITAVATDNEGATTTSSAVSLIVNNPAPVVSITTPTTGATYALSDVVTISGTATDDGTVATIEIRVNGTLVNSPLASPFSYNYTVSQSGTQTIQVRAIDEEGAITNETVSIIVPSAVSYALIMDNDSMFCYEGSKFNVPVYRTNALTDVYGFDIEITYEKDQVAPTGFISINDDMINHLYAGYSVDIKENLGKMIVSLYLNGIGGIDLFNVAAGDTAQVVSVEFERLSAYEINDSVLFSATIVESFDTYTVLNQVQPNYFTVAGTNEVEGVLKYWSSNEAIGYNGTNLITEITPSLTSTAFTPNASGEFTYDFSDGDTIAISRDIDDDTDVMPIINGFDALLTAFVVVEDPRFTPNIYQIIAMDVNMDGVISSGDVSQINQRTTALRNEFVQVGSAGKDWAFIDNADVLTNPTYQISSTYPLSDGVGFSKNMIPSITDISLNDGECASPEKTIMGIMIGDANGSYKNLSSSYVNYNLLKSEPISETIGSVSFDMANAIENENYIDVPVTISSDFAIQSLDFEIQINEENLSFVGVINENTDLRTLSNFNNSDNTLRFTSYSFNELTQEDAVVLVRFEKLSDSLEISDITSTQAYLNGESVSASTIISDEDGSIIPENELVANIYPLPVHTKLNIIVSEKSNITISNVLSQQLIEYKNAVPNIVHVIDVESLPKGTYYVTVYNDLNKIVKVIVKE